MYRVALVESVRYSPKRLSRLEDAAFGDGATSSGAKSPSPMEYRYRSARRLPFFTAALFKEINRQQDDALMAMLTRTRDEKALYSSVVRHNPVVDRRQNGRRTFGDIR